MISIRLKLAKSVVFFNFYLYSLISVICIYIFQLLLLFFFCYIMLYLSIIKRTKGDKYYISRSLLLRIYCYVDIFSPACVLDLNIFFYSYK